MSFYPPLVKVALDQIKAKGQPMALGKVSGGTYNPAAGSVTGGSVTTHSFFALDRAMTEREDAAFRTATLVVDHRRTLVAEASTLTVEPAPGDTVTFGGNEWLVRGVSPVSPGGVAVLYKIGVTR